MNAKHGTEKGGNGTGVRLEIIAHGPHFTEGRSMFWDPEAKQWRAVDATMSRLYFTNGRIILYDDQALAYAVWLALPKGTRAAFRGRNDTRPVYPWDYVDAP